MSAPIIAHVLDHALPELSGYSVRSHNILRALRRHGLPVVALAPLSGRAPGASEIDGVPYLRLPHRASRLASLPRLLGTGLDLRRALAGRSVALLHAHSPVRTALPALWAARRARVPFVYEIRGVWEDSAVQRLRMTPRDVRYRASRALDTWLMRRADALTVISHALIREVQSRGVPGERIVHVPNRVDAQRFQPRPPDAALARRHGLAGHPVIGFIGFFSAFEGVDVLVRAFAALGAAAGEARLLLVGDGDMDAALRTELRRLRLEDRVVLTGRVAHAEIERYYSLCDVVAYPRRRGRATELATPLRPLEAMAMGRAVVASDVGGLRELIRDGETGVLVPPDDVNGLAAALLRLVGEPSHRARLQDAARRFADDERGWAGLAPVYADVYARLLGAAASVRA